MSELDRFSSGEIVSLPKGRSYKIAEVLGPAGTVHITAPHENSPPGRFFVITWYPSRGINHPVPRGFDNVDTVMRQHQHVINEMVGGMIIAPESDEYPEEAIQVPGELDRLREYDSYLSRAAQRLLRSQNSDVINRARADIDHVLSQGLSRPRTIFKIRAQETLRAGSLGGPEQALGAALGAQRLNLKSEESDIDQAIATAARFNAIYDRDQSWRKSLDGLEGVIANAVRDLRHANPEQSGAILQRMKEPGGVRGVLNDFTGEPYYTPAQKVIKELSAAQKGEAQSYSTRLANLLATQGTYVNVWRGSRNGQASPYRIDLDLANVDTRRIA